MAREFDGSADYAIAAADLAQLAVGSIGGWINPVAYPGSGFACICTFLDGTTQPAGTFDKSLEMQSTGALQGYVYDGGAKTANSALAMTIGTWSHGLMTFSNASDLNIYQGGVLKTTTVMGADSYAGYANPRFGLTVTTDKPRANVKLAEFGIWSVVLVDSEVRMLAAGVSPLRVRPDALLHYWPIYGIGSPEPDFRGGINLDLTSAPPQTDHAPVAPIFFDFGSISIAADAAIAGDIVSTLSAVTAALTGEEAFLGTVAADLNAVTAALVGAETISGDIAGALSAVTTALAGDVVSPVEGDVAGALAALTVLIQGETDGAELDVAGPVFAKGTYERLRLRRKKKREDLEALAHDLRVLLGLGPDLPPGEPVPAGAVASVDFTGGMATPFLVGISQDPLRTQVARMLAAVKEIEARHAAALDDDDDAILAMMEAA
jgi:hypothetical protein